MAGLKNSSVELIVSVVMCAVIICELTNTVNSAPVDNPHGNGGNHGLGHHPTPPEDEHSGEGPDEGTSTIKPVIVRSPKTCFDCDHNNPCKPVKNNVYYYGNTDPSKFVQCDANGGCFIMPCPRGLVWDIDQYTCYYPTGKNTCKAR